MKFATKEEADKQIHNMRNNNRKGKPNKEFRGLTSYWCDECGAWNFTSRKKRKYDKF